MSMQTKHRSEIEDSIDYPEDMYEDMYEDEDENPESESDDEYMSDDGMSDEERYTIYRGLFSKMIRPRKAQQPVKKVEDKIKEDDKVVVFTPIVSPWASVKKQAVQLLNNIVEQTKQETLWFTKAITAKPKHEKVVEATSPKYAMCKGFLEGKCRYGTKCRFAHNIKEITYRLCRDDCNLVLNKRAEKTCKFKHSCETNEEYVLRMCGLKSQVSNEEIDSSFEEFCAIKVFTDAQRHAYMNKKAVVKEAPKQYVKWNIPSFKDKTVKIQNVVKVTGPAIVDHHKDYIARKNMMINTVRDHTKSIKNNVEKINRIKSFNDKVYVDKATKILIEKNKQMKLTIDKYNIDINTKFVMPVKDVEVVDVVDVVEVVEVVDVVEVVEVVDVVEVVEVAEVVEVVDVTEVVDVVKPSINLWQQRIIDIVNKSPNRYVKQVEPVVVEPVVETVITPTGYGHWVQGNYGDYWQPTSYDWRLRTLPYINHSRNSDECKRFDEPVVVVEPVVVEPVVVEPVVTPRYIQNPWTNFRPYIPKQEQNTTKTMDTNSTTNDGWITVKPKEKKPVIVVELCRFFKKAGWCRYGNKCYNKH